MTLSIHQATSQELARIFDCKDPTKILIVPVDTAKATHVARICDGTGAYLSKSPLHVENSRTGITFLEETINKTRCKHKIPKSQVVIALEDPATYAMNFFYRLAECGFLVVRVNARGAAMRRRNTRTSSDTLDLDGICRMVLERKAYDLRLEFGIFAELRTAAKERRRLVRLETALKNTIHRNLEVLFPGFSRLKAVNVFGGPALRLMADNFHAERFAKMSLDALTAKLRKLGDPLPAEGAASIIAAAKLAPPCRSHHEPLCRVLAGNVAMLESIRCSIAAQTTAMGLLLAQTPGVYLTTVPGIGVVLAAHIVAELGPIGLYGTADRAASYAGVIPMSAQSGGPDSVARPGHLPSSCNLILKDYLMQAAYHAGTTLLPGTLADGCDNRHDLMQYFAAKEVRGGKSRLATARKLLRLLAVMASTKAFYLPKQWFAAHQEVPGCIPAYLESMAEALTRKWQAASINAKENNDELGTMIRAISDLARNYRAGRVLTLEN